MKIQIVIVLLVAAFFAVPVFADHNRIDHYGRKQGHWIEFPEQGDLLVKEGHYVDGREYGKWVWRWADGKVSEGPIMNGK